MIDKRISKFINLTNILFVVFLLFTILLKIVDVKAIGPDNSKVGFAAINGAVHNMTGVTPVWYNVTKYAGYMIIVIAIATLIYGVYQFFITGSIKRVDQRLLVLMIMYVFIAFAYAVFELIVINRRPVVVNGSIAASYPSSHTLLAVSVVLCIMFWLKDRIENYIIRYVFIVASIMLTATVVIGRLLSGYHWFTDILGGIILGAAIVSLYVRTIEDMR